MATLPTDLTTLAAVKLALAITDGSADTLLQQQISALSLDFMREILRPDFFPAKAYTELLCGKGSHRLYLRHYPVNSIASVTYVDGTVLTAAGGAFLDGYSIEDNSSGADPEAKLAIILRGSCFPRACLDIPNISVVYNGGYAAVPADVEQAIIQCVTTTYKLGIFLAQQTVGSGQSVQIGDYSESVSQTSSSALVNSSYAGSSKSKFDPDVVAHYLRPSSG